MLMNFLGKIYFAEEKQFGELRNKICRVCCCYKLFGNFVYSCSRYGIKK